MKESREKVTRSEQNFDPNRVRQWEEMERRMNEMGDFLGKGIDEKIKETVIALNLYGFTISNSCEGHLTRGVAFPFVNIEASGKPKWTYKGEKELFEAIANEKHISLEKLDRTSDEWDLDVYLEVQKEQGIRMTRIQKEGNEFQETLEYAQWKEKNKKLYNQACGLVDEYARNNSVSDEELKIIIDGEGSQGFQIRTRSGFKEFVDALRWMDERSKNMQAGREMTSG
jgi:hypothetical protein